MPYKDPKCEAALASQKRRTDKYNNSEKGKAKQKQWALDNPEKRKITQDKHDKKRAPQKKIYDQTEARIKCRKLNDWKRRGIIGDYDALYDIYIDTLICDNCQVWLNTDQKTLRCHDHCDNCGLSKGMVCWECNIRKKVECQACN